MTTFEITIIILAVLGLLMMGWLVKVGKDVFEALQVANIQIRDIKTHTNYLVNLGSDLPKLVDISNQMQNAWACDVTTLVKSLNGLTDIVDKMHRNLCVEIADKMVNKMYPVNEGESLDAPFELDYKLKKDIKNKLNGFAAAVLDAECCPQEILDLWTERICESAHKFIKQFKIDWDKLSKEQQDEFLKRLILPNYDKPFQPIYTPCYAPDGICSNPFGDCINCPKRGTGGTWSTSTSIKAKDAVDYADALVAELKRSDDVYAECRRMDAINTASVCENMTKIQKELQKKGGRDDSNND